MKELIYIEFLQALEEGKKLRRIDWDFNNAYIQRVRRLSRLQSKFYIRKTQIFPNGREEYCSYSLDGDDIFTAKWVEV
jgi:hypothetical protein